MLRYAAMAVSVFAPDARAEGPFTYDPYGNVCKAAGTGSRAAASGLPFRFQGMRLDAATGLYYDRARMYSPGDVKGGGGRFLQTDPVGYDADMNLYTYVANDPLDRLDPTGLAPGDYYATPEDAAIAALDEINPTSKAEDTEYAGRIYKFWFSNGYSYTAPNRGEQASSNPGTCVFLNCIQAYHTHGGNDPQYDNENFSPEDMQYAEGTHQPLWLETPLNRIREYDPSKPQGHKIKNFRGPGPVHSHNQPTTGHPSSGNGGQPQKSGGPPTFLNKSDDPNQSHLCTGSRIPTTGSCS